MANLFGQYQYKDTFIHRLDARTKIILLIGLSIILFLPAVPFAFMIIFIILLLFLSRMSIKNLIRNLRPFLFFFTFILIMYLLFSREDIHKGIASIWRFLLLIALSSILTYSTTTSELVRAIERLFAPLRLIRISPRNIAVMVSATIRFIPVLLSEAGKVRDAQGSRGASLRKPKHVAGFANTLIRKTFSRAANLADAIQSRCYRDKNHTHFVDLRLKSGDVIAMLAIIFLLGALWT